MGSSSWELGGFETCAAGDDQIWGCGQSCAISLPQMTRSVHCSASGPWHARRGVAFRGCERAALQLQPIEEGLQPGNVLFRRYARGRPGGIHLKFQFNPQLPQPVPRHRSRLPEQLTHSWSWSLAFGCRSLHARP